MKRQKTIIVNGVKHTVPVGITRLNIYWKVTVRRAGYAKYFSDSYYGSTKESLKAAVESLYRVWNHESVKDQHYVSETKARHYIRIIPCVAIQWVPVKHGKFTLVVRVKIRRAKGDFLKQIYSGSSEKEIDMSLMRKVLREAVGYKIYADKCIQANSIDKLTRLNNKRIPGYVSKLADNIEYRIPDEKAVLGLLKSGYEI